MFGVRLIYYGFLDLIMYRKVALILFYDKRGRILLQNRRGISKHGEEWGYFGGRIKPGETAEDAIIREVKEELDFDLKEYTFIGIVRTTDQRGKIKRHVFISPLPDMKQLKQKEGKNMQLFSLQEAKKVKSVFGDDKVIRKLEQMKWSTNIHSSEASTPKTFRQ